MNARYVEMAVCESCRRVFHPASMSGGLCMSCASRRIAPKPAEPPAGFEAAVCPDCGVTFSRPRSAGRTQTYCWKCADKRRKASNRAALRKLRARRKVSSEA